MLAFLKSLIMLGEMVKHDNGSLHRTAQGKNVWYKCQATTEGVG
jgi:hypothetical protein